jgi:hypothetical protein
MSILSLASQRSSLRFLSYASGIGLVAAGLANGPSALAEEGSGGGAAAAYLEQARGLQARILTFDSHVDIPYGFAHPGDSDGTSQFDLTKAKQGGVKGASLAIFVQQPQISAETLTKAKTDAERKYESIVQLAKQYPDKAEIAYTPADVRRIEAAGKFAIVLSILNTYSAGRRSKSAGCLAEARCSRDWICACGEQSMVGQLAAERDSWG